MISKEEIVKRNLRIIKKLNPWIISFNDLVFEEHPTAKGMKDIEDSYSFSKEWGEARQSKIDFEGGRWISILLGGLFYSNGIDTYELYSSELDDPLGYISKEEVDEYLIKFQIEFPKVLLIENKLYYNFYDI